MDITMISTVVGAVAAAVWAGYERWQKGRVQSAKNETDLAYERAERDVYEQMNARMTQMDAQITRLQGEVDTLRNQLRERDMKIHALEIYVADLQHILQGSGIGIPPMRT